MSGTKEGENTKGHRGTDGDGHGGAFRGRSLDDGGQPRGYGNLVRGTGGILATGHSRHTGGRYIDTATNTTGPGGTLSGRALISLL
jgi:hypothetical protein